MKKIIGVLLLVRAAFTVAILLILVMAFNAVRGHLVSAQEHLNNAGDELDALAGDLQDNAQVSEGIFLSVADSAESITTFLDELPDMPQIDTELAIDVPFEAARIIDVIPLGIFGSDNTLSEVIEDYFRADVPFAEDFNTFANDMNNTFENLEVSFTEIQAMSVSLDTVSDELQLANNEFIAAATALNNLPGNVGTYLPALIGGFIILWLVVAILMDLQRGLELLSRSSN